MMLKRTIRHSKGNKMSSNLWEMCFLIVCGCWKFRLTYITLIFETMLASGPTPLLLIGIFLYGITQSLNPRTLFHSHSTFFTFVSLLQPMWLCDLPTFKIYAGGYFSLNSIRFFWLRSQIRVNKVTAKFLLCEFLFPSCLLMKYSTSLLFTEVIV